MSDGAPVEQGYVYLATVAVGDDHCDPGTEIVGVFTTLDQAWDAAVENGPYTALVERLPLNATFQHTPVRWKAWDPKKREMVTHDAS